MIELQLRQSLGFRILVIVPLAFTALSIAEARAPISGQPQKKYDSYRGLVMTGYQGWFNAETDGAGKKWTHYSREGKFEPGHCSIDFWPDMSEYETKYKTAFRFADGSPAYVFSSYDASTVELHFQWMAQQGKQIMLSAERGIPSSFCNLHLFDLSAMLGVIEPLTVGKHAMIRPIILMVLCSVSASAADGPMPFGGGGQVKMIYDHRQKPQAVLLNDKIHIVYNGGGAAGDTTSSGKLRTHPFAITYDLKSRTFSDAVALGPSATDHHHGPVIWVDSAGMLHVLHGCHKTPGTHLVSKTPGSIGHSRHDWVEAETLAPGISYPTIYRLPGNRTLIYYRVEGHSSSWTYRISRDGEGVWIGPPNDVTDMDAGGRPEWSSYQTKQLSRDGRYLHVAFMTYDDVKSNDPKRLYNPRYDKPVSNGWKYNLYYIKIDLQTHEVFNVEGERMKTPIDADYADAHCRIWDTQWRGAGVPPAIVLDQNDEPSFLHVISEDTLQKHRYYYIRREAGRWLQTAITRSNHQWNSGHLTMGANGDLHTYLITGSGYLTAERQVDRYGGGRIEEWVSTDHGHTWHKARDVMTDQGGYEGWKFNNIQPVTRPDGSEVPGMLLFYGWDATDGLSATGFLLDERESHGEE